MPVIALFGHLVIARRRRIENRKEVARIQGMARDLMLRQKTGLVPADVDLLQWDPVAIELNWQYYVLPTRQPVH